MALYRNYTVANAVAFNGTTFACLSVIVFLAASQPFYLSQVLGLSGDSGIGSIIGTLGFLDECIVLTTAPLVGALSDEITGSGLASGVRVVVTAGFAVIGISLVSYALIVSSLFKAYLARAVFALGVGSVMTMATVMFTEISNSDFSLSRKSNGGDPELQPLVGGDPIDEPSHDSGKFAAVMGVCAGLGAIFSVSFFLTLPARILEWFPDLSGSQALKYSFLVVALYAFSVGAAVYFFVYAKDVEVVDLNINQYVLSTQDNSVFASAVKSYFNLLLHGFEVARRDRRVQLAYVGAFVARLAAVSNTIFVPLLVFKYFSSHGLCEPSGGSPGSTLALAELPSQDNCKSAYIFAAILTGVGQTVSLLVAPIWAFIIDSPKVGPQRSLVTSTLLGAVSCFVLCLSQLSLDGYNPKNVTTFIVILLLGTSQMGTLTSSMSLLGITVADTKDHSVVGSVSGLFSLFGGVGILVVTLVGGTWSDTWVKGPFFVLGGFNLIGAILCAFG